MHFPNRNDSDSSDDSAIRSSTVWDVASTMFTLVVKIPDYREEEQSPILKILTTSENQARLRDSSDILFTKKQRKETSKRRKNLTNSVNYESADEQPESEFYYPKAITTRTRTLKMTIIFYAIRTICKVCCLKKPYNKPLINFNRFFHYGKISDLAFCVLSRPRRTGSTSRSRSDIFTFGQ